MRYLDIGSKVQALIIIEVQVPYNININIKYAEYIYNIYIEIFFLVKAYIKVIYSYLILNLNLPYLNLAVFL